MPTTRDELIECAALIHAIRSGDLERIDDSAERARHSGAADRRGSGRARLGARTISSRCPHRVSLSQSSLASDFDAVIEMLSEGIATSRGRSGALLHHDRVNGRVRGRRGARLAAITSGGAIPENAAYTVIAEPEGQIVGTLDEDFAVESLAGDVFLLGTHSWRIRHVEQGKVHVEDAHGAAPSIPFWLGEAPGRSPNFPRPCPGSASASLPTRNGAGIPAWTNADSMRPAPDRRSLTCARARPRWVRCHRRTRSSPSAFSTKPAACN